VRGRFKCRLRWWRLSSILVNSADSADVTVEEERSGVRAVVLAVGGIWERVEHIQEMTERNAEWSDVATSTFAVPVPVSVEVVCRICSGRRWYSMSAV